jgi:hypothetical protein
MRILMLVLMVFFSVSLNSVATAEQRSREQCREMADQRGLVGISHPDANRRSRFIKNCMSGKVKKGGNKK